MPVYRVARSCRFSTYTPSSHEDSDFESRSASGDAQDSDYAPESPGSVPGLTFSASSASSTSGSRDSSPNDASFHHARPGKYKKRIEGKAAPRPPNAFLCFRSDFYRIAKTDGYSKCDQRKLSSDAGKVWVTLSEVEKEHYRIEAEVKKRKHEEMYPDYKYHPQRKQTLTHTKRARKPAKNVAPKSARSHGKVVQPSLRGALSVEQGAPVNQQAGAVLAATKEDTKQQQDPAVPRLTIEPLAIEENNVFVVESEDRFIPTEEIPPLALDTSVEEELTLVYPEENELHQTWVPNETPLIYENAIYGYKPQCLAYADQHFLYPPTAGPSISFNDASLEVPATSSLSLDSLSLEETSLQESNDLWEYAQQNTDPTWLAWFEQYIDVDGNQF